MHFARAVAVTAMVLSVVGCQKKEEAAPQQPAAPAAQQSAQAEGITPQEWVDRISGRFADTWRVLGIGNDDFIRTSQPRHHRAVHALIKRIEHSGDLYKGTYSAKDFDTDEEDALRVGKQLAALNVIIDALVQQGISVKA